MSGSGQTYFQKGFNLKDAVRPVLAASYHSTVVDRLKALGYAARAGDVQVKLAREFGFCYGVDRAVEYAYETREKFPQRRIFLSGEIIHNPEVNGRIAALGIRILPEQPSPELRYAEVDAADVLILPAFGVPFGELQLLRAKGCVLVDTTCGSVLNVWKNVHRYAREGFTAVIHGKHYHEETRATASQALTHPDGRYLCVRDLAEADLVCGFVRGELRRVHADGALPRLGEPRLRPAERPAEDRAGEPDDDADDARASPSRSGCAPPCWRAGARPSWRRASGPSTPSARPRRTARTRCCACWTRAGSIAWW